ncbi:MAG: hypothetical protein JSS81_07190 [Acidobacteria bacterium]|nr:hypothetical protein [Acidobacteriota bacterium]
MKDEMNNVPAEEAGKKIDEFIKECEVTYGKHENAMGLDFKDGRRCGIISFENGFIVRLFNPKNKPEEYGVQINLSREAFAAIEALYFFVNAARGSRDDDLLREHLIDEHREALDLFTETVTAQIAEARAKESIS